MQAYEYQTQPVKIFAYQISQSLLDTLKQSKKLHKEWPNMTWPDFIREAIAAPEDSMDRIILPWDWENDSGELLVRSYYLKNTDYQVNPGDIIVKDRDGHLNIFSDDEFHALFANSMFAK